eukprot:gene641-696_t
MKRFLRRDATSKRPPDTDFTQMRLKPWPQDVKPLYIAIALIIFGVIFIPSGVTMINGAHKVYEKHITYDDGTNSSLCFINTANAARQCQVTFEFDEDVSGPVRLYYVMENFYQNHRRYYQSRDISQLQGTVLSEKDVELSCTPLYKNGSKLLNPCGLVANSFFTDVFAVDAASSLPANLTLDETDIALPSDKKTLFNQVDGFESVAVANSSVTCAQVDLPDSCKSYYDAKANQYYLFYYPDDDTTQYLYETYPQHISPLEGVTNEHFIVWMRTAMMPTFRKLYGVLHQDFYEGDRIVINITANYEVGSYDATKSLLISNLGQLGGKNIVPGQVFFIVGLISLCSGVALALRELMIYIKAKK